MKKSKLAITLIVLSAMGIACTQTSTKDLEGSFTGSDGSNQLPNQVDWTLAVTGDGLISGIWSSKGEISEAQISGKLGRIANEMILFVQKGSCTGQFHGDFTYERGELKGTLKNNPNCPERSYHFNLKKI